MQQKIVLISHSDLTGGAAVVTYRLMDALDKLGARAQMLVSQKCSADPRVHLIGSPAGRQARFLSERINIFTHNGFNRRDLFKVSIASRGYDLSRHLLVREADAIIISWINQGTLSLADIGRLSALGKPIAWMMHDMWPMTGICHHALSCDNYRGQCGNCPYIHLSGNHPDDLSARIFRRKMKLYDRAGSLKFVAVSSWLKERAALSSLLDDRRVDVIPNPFPVEEFYTSPRGSELPAGIDPSRRLIVMGAARLDDPIKDLPTAVAILNRMAEINPDLAKDVQAVFYGDLRDPSILEPLKINYVATGRINTPRTLRELYASSAAVISTSLFETLPGTLIEGMAGGCTPVTFISGGQRDIINDGTDGYLVKPRDIDAFADKLAQAISTPFDRDSQHLAVERRFSARSIATRYLELLCPQGCKA